MATLRSPRKDPAKSEKIAKVVLSRKESAKVDDLLEDPPKPSPTLRRAMAKRRSPPVES